MTRDIILLNRYIAVEAAAGAGGFKIGDVVALQYVRPPFRSSPLNPHSSPSDPNALLVKRIIGLPGSVVRTHPPHEARSVRIPAGHCWVEGDERYHSRDSNSYGPVPLGLLDSRVDFVFWPPRYVGCEVCGRGS